MIDIIIIALGLPIAMFLAIVFIILHYMNKEAKMQHELAMARIKAGETAGQEEADTPKLKEKEVIIKEIVMIPCQYCGGLMPQTATFCSNCGAGRKG